MNTKIKPSNKASTFNLFEAIRKIAGDDGVLRFERVLYSLAERQMEGYAGVGGFWQPISPHKNGGFLAIGRNEKVRVTVPSNGVDLVTDTVTACAAMSAMAVNHMAWDYHSHGLGDMTAGEQFSSLYYRVRNACLAKGSGVDASAFLSIID